MRILNTRPAAAACALAAFPALAGADAATDARPLVVELYTSEGCSSCPPADALLGELAARRNVLALGFHVAYWDDLGWTDRFDLPLSAQRQAHYARRLPLQTVYTPQLVVDGREEVAGYDRGRIARLLVMPHTGVPVHLVVAGAELVIHVDAAVAAASGAVSADVLLAPYLRQADTAIGRGENRGRLLREFNIVRALHAVGTWRGAAVEWRVSLAALPADATDVAVLVQRPDTGAMIGAASAPLPR